MPKMNHSNPQNDPQEEGFLQKVRSMRVNRAVFLSAVVILLALAVILVITAVTNRARRKNAQDVLMGAPSTVEQKQLDELSIACTAMEEE